MAVEVEVPAGFVPQYAVAFGAVDGPAVSVNMANPLPVRSVVAEAATVALAGIATASGVFGPFVPALDHPIRVTLSGAWTGAVELVRSVDGGATKLPLTIGGERWGRFTGNANEIVTEEREAAASYFLAVALQSGTLAYRVSQ